MFIFRRYRHKLILVKNFFLFFVVPFSLISESLVATSIFCCWAIVDLGKSSFKGVCISFVSIQGLARVNWIEEPFHVEQARIWIFISSNSLPRAWFKDELAQLTAPVECAAQFTWFLSRGVKSWSTGCPFQLSLRVSLLHINQISKSAGNLFKLE